MQHISEYIEYMKSIMKEYGDIPMTYTTKITLPEKLEMEVELFSEPRIRKPKRSKWHRVEDEMPDNGRYVAVWNENVEEARIDRYDCFWWNENGANNITHWRELPKFKRPK